MLIAIVNIPGDTSDVEAIRKQMLDGAQVYRDLGKRGLLRKHYFISPGMGGGVYLWNSRAEAEAWFDDKWRAYMLQKFGPGVTVNFYDSLITVDNTNGKTVIDGI